MLFATVGRIRVNVHVIVEGVGEGHHEVKSAGGY